MKLTILHLSDIHVRGSDDPVLSRALDVASTTFLAARESDACLIAVTGDVAFSGDDSQYGYAAQFLDTIRSAIAAEGCPLVDIIVAPGNHDCRLVPENAARTILIERLISEPQFASDPSIIDICVEPQEAFFRFRDKITSAVPAYAHKLWFEYEFPISGKVVRMSVVNASWMSRIPEQPGQLVYPVELFQEFLAEAASLRLVLVHHPLNWYAQSSYHPLRKALRAHADVVLSGHEHAPNSGLVIETLGAESLYYEAGALQPAEEGQAPSFAVLQFDIARNAVRETRYGLSAEGLSKTMDVGEREIRRSDSRRAGEFDLTQEFLEQLADPGGNFTHPEKAKVELDDVFVYPDVREISADVDKDISSPADSVLFRDHEGQRLLFLADEKAGKTILLLRAFREYHARGLVPLYIKASEISSTSSFELGKRVERCASAQYVKPDSVGRTPAKRKVVLVDDIDRLRGGANAFQAVVTYFEAHFAGVILTATSGFELSELLSKDAVSTLQSYAPFEVLPFGHRLRLQLIRKWCLCGSVTTTKALDKRVHDIERIVSAVVGKSLVPSQPLYLLILLQSCQQQQQSELQNSGFAYYYQYLITKSLKESGVKPDELNELFNYLANLAWVFRTGGVTELSLGELRHFNQTFTEKFVFVDLSQRLQLLCDARILHKRGEHYSFTYPYVFFYFVGKYLADNLENAEVKEMVLTWCSNLHRSSNAHSVLFLTHHRSDAWVIERIANVVRECFADQRPMEFDGDLHAINALVESASQLLISESDVARNQEEERALRDEYDEDDSEDSEISEQKSAENDTPRLVDFFGKFNLLLRTAEILGQILKNYYGSLTRSVKADLLRETIEGPLRLLRALMEGIAEDPEGLVRELETILQKQGRIATRAEDREKVRRLTFQLLGAMCTGIVARTAQFVGAEKLDEDLSALVEKQETNAYRLVEAATWLTRAGDLPLDRIRKLSESLERNVFAYTMLQSLAAYHLHLFHTDEQEKQKLCAHLKISMTRSRAIDVRTGRTKIFKRRQKSTRRPD